MPSKSHSSFPDAASQSDALWDQAAMAVDALAEAWEKCLAGSADEPNLADFLPSGDDALRKLVLPELVKVDLEIRWQHDCAPRLLESYAKEFPELGSRNEIPMELIHEELQVRMQAGKRVSDQEIRNRFPDQASALETLVGGMAVAGTPTDTYYADTEKETGQKSHLEPASEVVLSFEPGNKVDDFELLTLLGKGAFAQVFLARQVSLERLVALKISSTRGNEPQILAQLDHPHVVRVFDQRQNQEPPVHLLYMEVVPGGTLLEVIRHLHGSKPASRTGATLLESVDKMLSTRGAAPPENSPSRSWLAGASWPLAVCRIGAQLAQGLAYAHEKGVMHRDIKPANVLLTPAGAPKLADFNVSYNGGRADENPEEAFGGSLSYMSPEQLQACHPMLGGSPQLVRGASDVYSLGVLLWELLTGRRPFDDESESAGGGLARIQRMIDARHYADFAQLEKQLPKKCPASLRQVLLRCLQPRKDERYRTAAELAQALELCLHPQTWKLLQEPTNFFTNLPLQFPLSTIICAGLAPNALGGYFNLEYNYERIATHFPDLLTRFMTVQKWINGIAFPVGILVGIWIAIRVRRLLGQQKSTQKVEDSRVVLFFGLFISMLTLSLWTVSGIIFPIAVNAGLPLEGAVGFYTHFFTSLALCGIVAMAYPYFFLTALSVSTFFPALIRKGVVTGPRWGDLQRLRKLNRGFLALTALVPMLGLLLAVAIDSEQKWAQLVAGVGGIVGFAVMYACERLIDRNLSALENIAVDAPRNL